MPIVRELVNRISFKISPADKKNATGAIDSMTIKSKELLNSITKAGAAFGTAFAAGAAIGVQSLTDFEKKTGMVKFFARNQEEAQQLFEIFDKIAKGNDEISRKQARSAAGIISTTTLTVDQVKELSSYIEQLSIARPDLGITGVAEAIRAVTGGDLEAFVALVPGFKNVAELRALANFSEPFAQLTGAQRGDELLAQLIKKQLEINRLALDYEDTLDNQKTITSALTSDFFLKFGETIAPEMRTILELINKALKGILESKGFWDGVKTTAEVLQSAFEKVDLIITSIQEKGFLGAAAEEMKKGGQKSVGNMMFSGVGAFGTGQDPLLSKPVLDKNESLMKELIHTIKDLLGVKYPGSEQKSIDVNVNLNGGSSTSINMGGYEYKGIFMALADIFKNMSVQNGGGY